jgi:hypothetical protein
MPEPDANVLKAAELVFNLLEGLRPLLYREIFEQFAVPGCSLLGLDPYDTGDDLAVEDNVIASCRKLDEAVGHRRSTPILGLARMHR